MKQIVDKLNKIAKKIDESVEIPQTDLIIDSLDAITKAYGGTPNDSNLIVDKLEDIYNNIGSGVSGNIEITENGENINVAPYATATVNVAGSGGDLPFCTVTVVNDFDYEVRVSSINPETFFYQDPATQPEATCICLGVYGPGTYGYYTVCNPLNIPDPQDPGIVCIESDATNLVNLEWVEVYESHGVLKVIDITQPSSCTIPITVWQAS